MLVRSLALLLTASLLSASFHGSLQANDNWSSFRNGGSNSSSDSQLPVSWSPESGIDWQVETTGYGQSSPLYWEGTIYLTAVRGGMKEECLVLAYEAKTGNLKWECSIKATEQANNYYAKSRGAPTPVVDGDAVYALFESGDVVAVSHEGKAKWQRSLFDEYGTFENGHGLGSSLAHSAKAVFVAIDHSGPSYLLAVDKATGENIWKTERSSRASWTSPMVATIHGKEQVIFSSNGTVDGYDAESGDQLWSVDGISGNTIPSVAVSGSFVFTGAKPSERSPSDGKQTCSCIEVKLTDEGFDAEIKWQADKASCHYASPLVANGCVYTMNDVGVLYCLDRESGEVQYRSRTQGMCWATPVAVQKNVYLFGKNGTTTVVGSGSEFQEVAVNMLWPEDVTPKPETYTENAPKRSMRQTFVEQIFAADKNEDGKVTEEELPESMKRFFARFDLDSNGFIDEADIKAMESMRSSSGGSSSYGDPILYGVAIGESSFFIRFGTRLYCVSGK
ncbi:MAG: PQQ-binding-like beta-propeller repeat protein [Planctomycetota bacterium]